MTTDTEKKIIIKIDRSKPITPMLGSQKFEVVYQNEIAFKVTEFDFNNDTTFKWYTQPGELISAKERLDRMQAAGDVPLDMACLQALLESNELPPFALSTKWIDQWSGMYNAPAIKYVDFSGTLLRDYGTTRRDHIISLDMKRTWMRMDQCLKIFEINDLGWNEKSPCLVFTSEFIEKIKKAA